MNRFALIKIHTLLAAFMLPAACMFFVTGALYTWGFKGSYDSFAEEISLTEPLVADGGELQRLAEQELAKRGIALPTGEGHVKESGTSYKYEWTGSNRDVLIEPTGEPLTARLTVKDTSWYRGFVQLHKAKGGQLFKVYAALLVIALMTILVSGHQCQLTSSTLCWK